MTVRVRGRPQCAACHRPLSDQGHHAAAWDDERTPDWSTHARPAQFPRRLLPLHGDADDRDARRRGRHLRASCGRVRLRPAGRAHHQRIALVPRYRQKVRVIPGSLANPVWVDDEDFDVTYHVRRSALPKPGSDDQLRELVGRLHEPAARPAPAAVGDLPGRGARRRPRRHHHQDPPRHGRRRRGGRHRHGHPGRRRPSRARCPADDWRAARAPGAARRWCAARSATGQAADRGRRHRPLAPSSTRARPPARSAGVGERGARQRRDDRAAGARLAAERPIGEQRRFGMAATDLDDYKRVRKAHGGTINDVVLATVAGALRAWLLTRGEAVTPTTTIRAMVPVSVRAEGAGGMGNRVSSYFVDLPVGEGNPVMRLHQVSFAMRGAQGVGAVGRRRRARADVGLRAADDPLARRPGRQRHDAAAVQPRGHQRARSAVPAVRGRRADAVDVPRRAARQGPGVSIGLTSYNGGVYYGLNADRDAMPDVDVLAALHRGVPGRAGRAPCRADGHRARRRGLVLGARWRARCGLDDRRARRRCRSSCGWDPREADVLVGTSAGSVLAAFLGCGIGVDVLLDHQRGIVNAEDPRIDYDPDTRLRRRAAAAAATGHRLAPGVLRSGAAPVADHADGRAVGGAAAGPRLAEPIGELVDAVCPHGAGRRTRRPGSSRWTTTAAAASCSAATARRRPAARRGDGLLRDPRVVRAGAIGGRRYVDGGACSPTSLDLLAGCGLDDNGRPGRDRLGLADCLGLFILRHRPVHVRTGIGIPDVGRHLLVGVQARRRQGRVLHRLAEPDRPARDRWRPSPTAAPPFSISTLDTSPATFVGRGLQPDLVRS